MLDKAGLRDDDIVIRMTGCPNGCARPYLAEIGLVGRNPGLYNLYLGAAFDGSRLNKLYAQDVDKARIVGLLEPMFVRYAKERNDGERFGDFVIRAGYVRADDGRQQVPCRPGAGEGSADAAVVRDGASLAELRSVPGAPLARRQQWRRG